MVKNKFGKYALIVIALFVLLTLIYIGNKTGALSTIGSNCVETPVINSDGNIVQNYEELRSIYNIDLTDQEFLDLGIKETSSGLVEEICEVESYE